MKQKDQTQGGLDNADVTWDAVVRSTVNENRGAVIQGRAVAGRLLLAGLLVASGWLAHDIEARARAHAGGRDSLYRALGEFARVVYHVQRDYVDPIDGRQAVYHAIQGLLTSLDPHSRFFPKEQADRLRAATTGVTGGIGLTLVPHSEGCLVTNVLAGSPAARAGVRVGWMVLSIQGRACARLSAQQATWLTQGKVGSSVSLTFARPAGPNLSMTLKRVLIRMPAVESSILSPGIGYVRIRVFQPGTAGMVAKALTKMRTKTSMKALVLDLRKNPGGLFAEGMAVADMFVARGLLVTRKLRGNRIERMWAHRAGTVTDLDLAVLVDSGTASAAELAAAALRDNGRALLVGKRTYGKGSIQELISFPEGSILKLTVGRYYTPKGTAVDRHGIDPDMQVRPGAALALPLPKGFPVWARSDWALRTAVSTLLHRGRTEP